MPMDVVFYRSSAGKEPVREWLRALTRKDKAKLGCDIKTVQYGWPIGMPVVRKLNRSVWEIRSKLDNRIARILITVRSDKIILLHGFIKKSRATQKADIKVAMARIAKLEKAQ